MLSYPQCYPTEAHHSSPAHFAGAYRAWKPYFQFLSSRDNEVFLCINPARGWAGLELLKQSDRSNYHLPTSSALTLMKRTTLHETSSALKLTFTFANNLESSYLEYLLRACPESTERDLQYGCINERSRLSFFQCLPQYLSPCPHLFFHVSRFLVFW